MNGADGINWADGMNGRAFPGDDFTDGQFAGAEADGDLLEELREAACILDPVPAALRRLAVEAYALHDLDARLAELTFDSLTDAVPVRGATDVLRMLTFQSGGVTVDVEVSERGLMGQVLPPQPATLEVLDGPQAGTPLAVDAMGRFMSDTAPTGPFALRLRTGGQVVVTEWLRA